MNITQEFYQWLQGYASLAGYQVSRGAFVESDANADQRFIVLQSMGGRRPGIIERYPFIRMLVLGSRYERQVSGGIVELEDFASGLIDYANENFKTDCFTQLRAASDIIGPGFTAEDRPWYELNFEIIL